MYISPDDGPDVAFLRARPQTDLAPPIELSPAAAKAGDMVALIGYPAKDSRIPEPDLMQRVFGDIYDKKRLAPGRILRADPALVLHDCSSLGGNSGSVVLSLATGQALALHFAGRFLEANYAVPSAPLAELLDRVKRGDTRPSRAEGDAAGAPAMVRRQLRVDSDGEFEVTIPCSITVRVGEPQYRPRACGPAAAAPRMGRAQPPARPHDGGGVTDRIEPEASPEDYKKRPGYVETFLGT